MSRLSLFLLEKFNAPVFLLYATEDLDFYSQDAGNSSSGGNLSAKYQQLEDLEVIVVRTMTKNYQYLLCQGDPVAPATISSLSDAMKVSVTVGRRLKDIYSGTNGTVVDGAAAGGIGQEIRVPLQSDEFQQLKSLLLKRYQRNSSNNQDNRTIDFITSLAL